MCGGKLSMTPPDSSTFMQCKDCGRHASHAGNACAYCGGPLLKVPQPAPPPPAGTFKHPQLLAAAVTFCLGLFVVQMVMNRWLRAQFAPRGNGSDALLLLQIVAAIGTVVYAALRSEEGDFRALCLVMLGFFVGQEAMSFIHAGYGLVQFDQYAMVTAFATTVYGSLALIAAAYDSADGPPLPGRKLMVCNCCLILVLSGLRSLAPTLNFLFGPAVGPVVARMTEIVGIVMLVAMLAGLSFWLLRAPGRGKTGGNRA